MFISQFTRALVGAPNNSPTTPTSTNQQKTKHESNKQHQIQTHNEEKSPTDENEYKLPKNTIGIEFAVGSAKLSSDLSFTQYFNASLFDTCLSFSVQQKEEDELLDDSTEVPCSQASRIRKSVLSDGFNFDWKGEKVLLKIPLSKNIMNRVRSICKSNLSEGSSSFFEHSSDSKNILPQVIAQIDNVSRASEVLHSYIVKCKPHIVFLGGATIDINRLLDFRSKSLEQVEVILKRGKDKIGTLSLSMRLILPPEPKSPTDPNTPELTPTDEFETISFDDSFFISQYKSKHETPNELENNYDSNFDFERTNTENNYEDSHYEIIELCGSGGFGKVFKARRKLDRGLVAIKKINCLNIDNANQALAEFFPVRRLEHKNLVQIEDLYFTKEQEDYTSLFNLCLVMEYMNCFDLDHLIREHKQQRKAIQEAHALSLLLQMTAGVNHLHRNGLLHRDIKPNNMMLKNKGKTCKVGDFGLVYNLRSLKNVNETLSSAGTRKYQAPECIIGVKDISESNQNDEQPKLQQLSMNYIYASDIWSLGLVFFELLSCDILEELPFTLVMKNSESFYELIKKRCSHYHPKFSELIISMLSVDPKDRPDSERILKQLLAIKNELYGQNKVIKIHPVIAMHRQLLSVGSNIKSLLLSPIVEEEGPTESQRSNHAGSSSSSRKPKRSPSFLSELSFGLLDAQDDSPKPTEKPAAEKQSNKQQHDTMFSPFGLW